MNTTIDSSSQALNSPYNYIPSEHVALTFLVLFGTSTVLHIVQAVWFRTWWLFPTVVIAGTGETIGWVGRYWSSQDVTNQTPFLMQITTTIISPTPLLAANFMIFARLTGSLGTQYSRLSPRWYSRIFLSCDIIALIVQATGGGIASAADTTDEQDLGSNIMLGGIMFQMAALVVFSAFLAEYFIRFMLVCPIHGRVIDAHGSAVTLVKRRTWTTKQKLASGALVFSSIVIFIRSVYRTIELLGGWNGRIISTEIYFNVLDGAMIVLAIYTLNFFHPGILLMGDNSSDGGAEGKRSDETQGYLMAGLSGTDAREAAPRY